MVHEFKSTMDRNFVNGYLGIDESYKMPERMMELLLNAEEREKMFDAFQAENPDMTGDLWYEYFQDEQGDRNALKQDFTPTEICQLVAEITPEAESYADYITPKEIEYLNDNRYMLKVREYLDSH